MKPRLVDYLICPRCRSRFTSNARGDSGRLRCLKGHGYPIRGGIPRMLRIDALDSEQDRTRRSFRAKWSRIPGYGHDPKTRRFQVDWYLQRYGWKTERNLARFLKTRRRMLEAGTGTGPLMEIYTRHAGEVFGLDISPAIESVQRHLGSRPNLHLVQADLRHAPFPPKFFDFIVSDQVLHHTPDTRRSFLSLVGHLSPGGEIAAYVYVKKGPIREFSDDYIRERTVKMSAAECYTFCKALTHLAKRLSDLKADIVLPEAIPLLGIPAGRHNVQRLIYWHVLKCFWNDDFDFETNVMINFDWYHPLNAFRHTPDEVRSWVREAKLKLVHLDVGPSGISFRARKT